MKKLLFICTGNTCRSPMAEMILKHLLKERNINNIEVSSCGILADVDADMTINAQKALQSLGVEVTEHKARQCNLELLENHNIVVTMTASHKNVLQSMHQQIYTISQLTGLNDISDPYGLDQEEYFETARQLYKACEIIIDTIV